VENKTVFTDISAKTKIFLKIYLDVDLGPRFMKKNRAQKSHATVPLIIRQFDLFTSVLKPGILSVIFMFIFANKTCRGDRKLGVHDKTLKNIKR